MYGSVFMYELCKSIPHSYRQMLGASVSYWIPFGGISQLLVSAFDMTGIPTMMSHIPTPSTYISPVCPGMNSTEMQSYCTREAGSMGFSHSGGFANGPTSAIMSEWEYTLSRMFRPGRSKMTLKTNIFICLKISTHQRLRRPAIEA